MTGTMDDTVIVDRSDVSIEPTKIIGGRYGILEKIGEGGMARVYRAHDIELDDIVALKLIRADIAAHPNALARFRREVKLARRVTHPNVARVYELGEHEGLRFLTMEYVPGMSLAQLIQHDGPQSVERTCKIVCAVCDGATAIHATGVVHRDIKPDNIMLTRDGRVVITDFGIARSVEGVVSHETNGPVGTPRYMSPEQLENTETSPRTDVYAIGLVAYELLTGRLPWTGDSVWDIAVARLREPPTDPCTLNPAIGETFGAIILECLQRVPMRRPTDAAVLGDALRHAVFGSGFDIGPITVPSMDVIDARMGEPQPTIAVMSLAHGDEEASYLAKGLALELSDALCRLRGIRVKSPRAVARIAQNESLVQLRDHLGIDIVLEGTVRATSAGVRVAMRMTDLASEEQRWAERFECQSDRLLALPDRIANAVASALDLDTRLNVRDTPLEGRAIELYLKARRALNHYEFGDAVALASEALGWAQDHPALLSTLAVALNRLCFIEPSPDLLAQASVTAARAVEVAPHLGESHVALASSKLHAGDTAGAARELRAAVTMSPSHAEAQGMLADLLIEARRIPDGARRARVAFGLDYELNTARALLARAMALIGDWSEVDRLFAEMRDVGAGRFFINQVRFKIWQGDDSAFAAIDAELMQSPPNVDTLGSKQLIEVRRGNASAESLLATIGGQLRLGGSLRRQAFLHQMAVETACMARQHERAIIALEGAARAQLCDLAWLDFCPLLAPLRDDERYGRVRGLAEQRADAICEAVWGQGD